MTTWPNIHDFVYVFLMDYFPSFPSRDFLLMELLWTSWSLLQIYIFFYGNPYLCAKILEFFENFRRDSDFSDEPDLVVFRGGRKS